MMRTWCIRRHCFFYFYCTQRKQFLLAREPLSISDLEQILWQGKIQAQQCKQNQTAEVHLNFGSSNW